MHYLFYWISFLSLIMFEFERALKKKIYIYILFFLSLLKPFKLPHFE